MNKTFKTVLITLGVTFVVLIGVVMIFGEDKSAAAGNTAPNPKENISASQAAPAEAVPASEAAQVSASQPEPLPSEPPTVELTEEMLRTALDYDIFSWNATDAQGKTEIVRDIMRVWDAGGIYYDIPEEGLVEYIGQNLYDQANIFEVACTAAQIDPLPFFDSLK